MKRKRMPVSSTGRKGAFDARLQLLRNDYTSPSLALTHQALDLAEDWLAARRDPKRLGSQLATMHPGIALIANVARMLTEETANLPRSIKSLRESLLEGNRLISAHLAELVPRGSSVITLSNSGTVLEALVHARVGSVYALESRPGGEGIEMAEQLRRHLTPVNPESTVHLIESTAIGNVVPLVDCAVVGVDAISRSGALLHKVGTLPLAICCRYFGKPLYALGHSLKKVDYEFGEPPSGNGMIETRIFDATPAELITRIVTERPLGAAVTA